MEKIKVSIGMPVYNGGKYLSNALNSLLKQDFKDFELIISDNASIDNTQRICLDYAARDKRIRYYRNEINKGSIWNFNQTFMLSQGEYFMWASCHDVWEPSYIAKCLEVLKSESAAVLCYSLADCIDVNGNDLNLILRGPDSRGLDKISRCHVILWGMQYAYPVYGLIRTDVLKKTKLFSKTIGCDNILLFELSLLGEFAQIPEVLLHIRKMPDFGSWDSYVEKCFNKQVGGLSCRLLFWEMIFEYSHVINRNVNKIFSKVVLMLSASFCVLIRYRWIHQGLVRRKK